MCVCASWLSFHWCGCNYEVMDILEVMYQIIWSFSIKTTDITFLQKDFSVALSYMPLQETFIEEDFLCFSFFSVGGIFELLLFCAHLFTAYDDFPSLWPSLAFDIILPILHYILGFCSSIESIM